MIEVKAKLNNAHVSPSKARLVAGAVRGLSVDEALARLPIIHKAAAPIIDKLLKSAVANAADQYEIKHGDLVIKSITVNKGLDLKRWRPAAFGRAHPFKKHFSHIEIVVVAREGVKANKKIKEQKVDTVKLTDAEKAGKDKDIKDVGRKPISNRFSGKVENRQGTRIDKKTTNK